MARWGCARKLKWRAHGAVPALRVPQWAQAAERCRRRGASRPAGAKVRGHKPPARRPGPHLKAMLPAFSWKKMTVGRARRAASSR